MEFFRRNGNEELIEEDEWVTNPNGDDDPEPTPAPSEEEVEEIIDPAMGSGGLLIEAASRLLKEARDAVNREEFELAGQKISAASSMAADYYHKTGLAVGPTRTFVGRVTKEVTKNIRERSKFLFEQEFEFEVFPISPPPPQPRRPRRTPSLPPEEGPRQIGLFEDDPRFIEEEKDKFKKDYLDKIVWVKDEDPKAPEGAGSWNFDQTLLKGKGSVRNAHMLLESAIYQNRRIRAQLCEEIAYGPNAKSKVEAVFFKGYRSYSIS